MISNNLYLDDEYDKDCSKKIDYLEFLFEKNTTTNELILTQNPFYSSDENNTVNNARFLKKISDKYNKIL